MTEAQEVSLWDGEWEEVQERDSWEVVEVDKDKEEDVKFNLEVERGRGIARREVATASPLPIHFIEVEEDGTCNVKLKVHLPMWITSTPCNDQIKEGGGSDGDEEQEASSLDIECGQDFLERFVGVLRAKTNYT